MQGAGCRVQGAGFRGSGCWVHGSGPGFRLQSLNARSLDFGLGLHFNVQGLGTDPLFDGLQAAAHRCRANMAHTRQAWPDSGLHFQTKVLEIF